MKKNIISISITSLLIFFTIQILLTSKNVMNAVEFSFSIWKSSIFPSLFPFFVISDILVNYGFVEFLGEIFKPLMMFLFKTKGECAYIFIMSMLSGFPSGAKYTRELVDKNIINSKEGTKILMFSHFSNPLFIIGSIATIFLNNYHVAPIILIGHYLPNILIGIIFRNYNSNKKEKTNFSLKKAINNMTNYRLKNNMGLGSVINNAINTTIGTLLLILGTVTMFLVITTIIDKNINLNPYYQTILNGFIEMTQGLKYVSAVDISLKVKTIISTMFISFGGLSVHIQILSIISNTKIKYFPFLVARIIHTLMSGIIVYFSFDYLINIF